MTTTTSSEETKKIPNLFFVFDVESVGLHGEGFAVGYVVVDREGNQHEQGVFACPIEAANGTPKNFEWCEKNIPKIEKTHDAPWLMRAAFWRKWLEWNQRQAVMVADCCWPVEARFLAQCVDDKPLGREWSGPYPLHDLASVLLAKGVDPLVKRERQEDELPEHHPLADAKQSARLLIEALKKPIQKDIDRAKGYLRDLATMCEPVVSPTEQPGRLGNTDMGNTPSYLYAGLCAESRKGCMDEFMRMAGRLPPFEAFVVTGISGIAFGAVAAHLLNVNLVVVRKCGESTHSVNRVEGLAGHYRWLFLDDFVDSGCTFDDVKNAMKMDRPRASCVGVVLYNATRGLSNFMGYPVYEVGGRPRHTLPF